MVMLLECTKNERDKIIAYYICTAGLSIGVICELLGLTLRGLSRLTGMNLPYELLLTYGLYIIQATPIILLVVLTALYIKRKDKIPALASLIGLVVIVVVILLKILVIK